MVSGTKRSCSNEISRFGSCSDKKKITGDIINVYEVTPGTYRYIVESDQEGPIDDPDAWNDVRFPQSDCSEEQLELI